MSSPIDFSHYLPPGVYTQSMPGPQLAVNSTAPTAVGIVGQALGYRTNVQTVQINADSVGTTPTVTVTAAVAGVPAVNDVQTVTIAGAPTGGTFTLTFGGQTTSPIAYNASANTGSGSVQSLFAALSSVGSANVWVSGSASAGYVINFQGSLAAASQTLVTADGSSLTGGTSPTVTVAHTTTGSAGTNAQQTVTVVATGGTYTLGYGGQTTVPIAYNATAASVQAALLGLSTISTNNVTVTGSAGGPYTVTFTGTLGSQAIALMVATPFPTLTPTGTQALAYLGINTDTLTATSATSNTTYTLNSDYTLVCIGGTNGTSDAQYVIERVVGGHIKPGDYVQLSYQYTDPTYYTPYIFYDYADVVAAYGNPFDTTTGDIQSGLTLMAKFAFLNGAYQVVCVAVESSTSPGNATIGDYGKALDSLKDQTLVGIVVSDNGQQPLHQLMQEHVDQQSNNRFERRAICALDGTVTAVPSSQRILDAQAISDSRVMLVSPATFVYFSPELNTSVTLGGQYMAASLAGITVSKIAAMPLTRKTVTGWFGIGEFEQEGQKNLESQNGLCVVEKTRQQLIQVRHGVSTNAADMLSREWSIIGQQDAMVYRLRDYLESDNLIGQPIYPYTLINVKGSADAALQSLIRDGLIVDYTGLKVRQLATNPDVLEVSFSWLPAFPLNYIVVTFSVSLTTGNLTSSTGTSTNQANVSSASTSTNVGVPTSSVINDFGGSTNTLQST